LQAVDTDKKGGFSRGMLPARDRTLWGRTVLFDREIIGQADEQNETEEAQGFAVSHDTPRDKAVDFYQEVVYHPPFVALNRI
jgi:hypothetical protein